MNDDAIGQGEMQLMFCELAETLSRLPQRKQAEHMCYLLIQMMDMNEQTKLEEAIVAAHEIFKTIQWSKLDR